MTDILTNTRQTATGLRLRNETHLTLPFSCLASFHRSFFPATTRLWNQLPSLLRDIVPRQDFARQVWQRFGTPGPPPFYSHGTKQGNTFHTQLRIGLSTLNSHLFQICYKNITSPECTCGQPNENTIHFMLWCPLYSDHRLTLFTELETTLPHFTNLTANDKLDILLYGKNASKTQQIHIARAVQTYIMRTRRFKSTV